MKISNLPASIIVLAFLFFLGSAQPGFAASRNTQAYIERQTLFNQTTDFFMTLGKFGDQKARIKFKRRGARRTARLQKIKKQSKKTEE